MWAPTSSNPLIPQLSPKVEDVTIMEPVHHWETDIKQIPVHDQIADVEWVMVKHCYLEGDDPLQSLNGLTEQERLDLDPFQQIEGAMPGDVPRGSNIIASKAGGRADHEIQAGIIQLMP